MLQGVIFDLDGTIAFTEQFHHQAFASVLKEYGIEFMLEEWQNKYAGGGSLNAFTKVFAERGIKLVQEEIEKCVTKKRERYSALLNGAKIPLVPGVVEFVKRVDYLHLKRIIATGNSDKKAVSHILERIGLVSYFPDILCLFEVKRGKPFPDLFLEALNRLMVNPADAVVFEDSINGVAAAKAAGIRCIALETTTPKALLVDAGAFVVVKDYHAVKEDMLFGRR